MEMHPGLSLHASSRIWWRSYMHHAHRTKRHEPQTLTCAALPGAPSRYAHVRRVFGPAGVLTRPGGCSETRHVCVLGNRAVARQLHSLTHSRDAHGVVQEQLESALQGLTFIRCEAKLNPQTNYLVAKDVLLPKYKQARSWKVRVKVALVRIRNAICRAH
jgi:hypothetical protein